MAKLTLEQKIAKVTDLIAKEEQSIELSKEKIRKWRAELKTLTAEKEQSFANEILKLMKSNGISHEELLAQLKVQSASQIAEDNFSPSDDSTAENNSANAAEFSTFK